jgi:uncharacterized protein (DUF1330 family)
MILDADVHDLEAYEKYKEAAPKYVARHGGEYCCRGGGAEVFVGDWNPKRIVMLKFPSRQNYDAFMADPDYKQWKELRESLTTIKQWLVVDGV